MNNMVIKANLKENIVADKININFKIEETEKGYRKNKYSWKQYHTRICYKKSN